MYTKIYFLYALWLVCLLSIATSSFAQRCNPTENWMNTGFPGTGANLMTEMNGNLYAIDFHVPRQEYVLFKYDGATWTEMSALPVGGIHYAIAAYQGQIFLAGSNPIFNGEGIVRWDSASNQWLSTAGGIGSNSGKIIHDLEVFQGELYAAGSFDMIGGVSVKGIAKWNGTRWDSVGNANSFNPTPSFSRSVYLESLHTWNNKLAIGGMFEFSGSRNIALWDGATVSTIPGSPDRSVEEMQTYQGDLVIYGTYIDSIGTTPINQMARWDGTQWHAMGMALSDFVDLRDMLEYQGELYVTGPNRFAYTVGGGMAFDGVAKWDGNQWYILTGYDRAGFGHGLKMFGGRVYLHGRFSSSCNRPIDHVVRLCTNLDCQAISGKVYQDDNNNCSPDAGEYSMPQQWVSVQPGNFRVPTDSSGNFYALIDTGMYTVNLSTLPNYYTSICPANGYNVTLTSSTGASGLDFGCVPVANVTDVYVAATTTRFRPGFTGRVHANFGNLGTLPQNGTISLTLDPQMTVGASSQTIASQNGQTITWNYSGLNPSQSDGIWLEASLPTTTQMGDTLCIIANIASAVGTDSMPSNNGDTIKVIVTGSYDPNDKQVIPAGTGTDGDIPPDTETLTYTIRFQNTGTDTAFTVLIRDEIDTDLDLETMAILGSSHAYRFEVEEGQRVKWTFDNILLPDSNINEPASHGFVKYQINLKPGLPLSTRIENTAYIYFDFNAPIITNTTVNTLTDPATTIDPMLSSGQMRIWPNPAREIVNCSLEKDLHQGELTVLDLQGKTVIRKQGVSGRRFQFSVQDLLPGMYIYRLEEGSRVLGVGKIMVK